MKNEELFDRYAHDYDKVLNDSLTVSGEKKDYFAHGRVAWLLRSLMRLSAPVRTVMDFGCGTGSAFPYLDKILTPQQITGVDVSANSIEEAAKEYKSDKFKFHLIEAFQAHESFDLAYSCCVFHHIPPAQRAENFKYIHQALCPGGIFALWEHNPLNPATQYIVSRCPFDKDAILLSASESKRVLEASGFEVLSIDFLFIFPALLKIFRPLEEYLVKLPLGAQYQVLCKKK